MFYVKKDTTPPSIPALLSPPDNAGLNYAGIPFDWADSNALQSGTSNYELLVATSSDFTTITASSSPVVSQAFIAGLAEKPYYWKVRAKDNAGNFSAYTSTYTFLIDLTTPTITDLQADATFYQTTNSYLYNIDFADSGASLLSKFQVKVTSGPNQSGTPAFDWSDNVTGINSASYTADWALAAGNWALLQPGTNYASVRVFDYAGNSSTTMDAFTIWKDTIPPFIADNQAGDDNWRKTDPGAIYDVDFKDLESFFTTAQYRIYDAAGQTGNLI